MLTNTPCRDLAFDGRRAVDTSLALMVSADQLLCAEVAGFIEKLGGFKVQCANSAEGALRVAMELLPGFVLLDADGLDLDCYRLAALLHQNADLHEARIIGLTRDIATVDRRAALAAGFEQFLTLPLLQVALETVLTGNSHRGPERHRAGMRPS